MASHAYLKTSIWLILITLTMCSKSSQRKWKSEKQTDGKIARPQIYNFTKLKHTFSDMPTKNELPIYLKTLEKIVNYCLANKNDIDLNFAFGMFLLNVNLRTAIKQNAKRIPSHLKSSLTHIVKKNNIVLSFFSSMVKQDKTPSIYINKLLYTLFMDENLWVERVANYDTVINTASVKLTPEKLDNIFNSWETYSENINNIATGIPNPKQSDTCIASLLENPLKGHSNLPICSLDTTCYHILINGTDFGYALTHRILLMLMARYGRGCSVFSPRLDREIITRFCTDAYAEAEYIALHNFQEIDLLMEQMSFCFLYGHVEFLQRQWLEQILLRQTPMGCFGYTDGNYVVEPPRRWTVAKKYWEQDLHGGYCNGHVTAVAATCFSSAVRYIINTN